jgi:hypothetical protein
VSALPVGPEFSRRSGGFKLPPRSLGLRQVGQCHLQQRLDVDIQAFDRTGPRRRTDNQPMPTASPVADDGAEAGLNRE